MPKTIRCAVDAFRSVNVAEYIVFVSRLILIFDVLCAAAVLQLAKFVRVLRQSERRNGVSDSAGDLGVHHCVPPIGAVELG
jgi:hypothetical protein